MGEKQNIILILCGRRVFTSNLGREGIFTVN